MSNLRTPDQYFEKARSKLASMRVVEALRLFNRAEESRYDPDACAAGRWQCRMLLGEFEEAWRESEAITARGRPDRNRFWDGKVVSGKSILIRCLHGLGDTLQFIRYVPLLREQGCTVTIEAQPVMRELLQVSAIADRVITWGEPEPLWDQQIEVTELPRVFRTTLHSVPRNIPYLAASQPEIPRPDERLRVGLNWASGMFNPERSIRLEQLKPLLLVENVKFFSVQAGPERRELRHFPNKIVDICDELGGILSAANTLAQIDLVITVDTMTAHLAGALGKPVWTILPFQCDWRWMLRRSDSPWYPTMVLFRQPRRGNWLPVAKRVAEKLSMLAGASNPVLTKQRSIIPRPAAQAR